MIRTESALDINSTIYLDIHEARRLQNAEFNLQSYEFQRERFEGFDRTTTLAEVIHRSRFFAQPSEKKSGWKSALPGASR